MARKPREMNPRQAGHAAGRVLVGKRPPLSRVADGGRRRSWVFRFVRGGKVTSMGLGAAGTGVVSLAAARDKAKELNKALEEGVNPLDGPPRTPAV